MAIYVSNWGNDINDGSDWAHAKKTLQGAIDSGASTVYSNGYITDYAGNNIEIYGQNNTVWDIRRADVSIKGINLYNIKVLAKDYPGGLSNKLKPINCEIFCSQTYSGKGYGSFNLIKADVSMSTSGASYTPCDWTEHLTIITPDFTIDHSGMEGDKNSIIDANTIKITQLGLKYILFIGAKFQLASGGDNDESTYTYPMGGDTLDDTTTDEEKMQNLRERAATVYGGNAKDYFIGCQYYSGAASDIFNDPDNDDYTLKTGTIATYMSYEGSYVGKYPPSLSWKFPDDFSNIVNFDGNKIADQTQDASAEGSIKDIGAVRQITNLPVIDSPAYRNGVNLNDDNVLQNGSISSGNIQAGHVYYVNGSEGDSITYNGTTYNYNEYFVGVDGVTTFTGSGIVREVYYNDYKRAMQWKFSRDDSTLSNAVKITLYAGQEPEVNTDTDENPTAGNADDNFDSANAVKLSARYMQPFILYKADQLKAY